MKRKRKYFVVGPKAYRIEHRKLRCPNCGTNKVDDLIRLRPQFFECRNCGHTFDTEIEGLITHHENKRHKAFPRFYFDKKEVKDENNIH